MLKSTQYSSRKWGTSPFLVILFLAFLLLSCGPEEIISPEQEPDPKPEVIHPDTTDMCVIVYMAAENSMSQENYFTKETFVDKDINEMLSAASAIPLSSRLIVYLDGTSQPILYEINSIEGKVVLEKRIEENSTDAATFESVIRQISTHYPSRRYGLVMWSHGSGWIPGPNKSFGIDNLTNSTANSGSEMEIGDMRQALEHLNMHFDYILFDACFMQCVETAYELRNHADYIIASPAEIPGPGAPYDKLMPMLMNPSESSCISMVDQYFSDYVDNDGAVLSLIKTNQLDSLLLITKQLCPDFYTQAYNLETNSIQPYCGFTSTALWKPEYFDMGSVMNQMLSFSDYSQWSEQLESTVISRRSTSSWLSIYSFYGFNPNIIDPDHLALVSIFVPNAKYDSNTSLNADIKETLWYKDYNLK